MSARKRFLAAMDRLIERLLGNGHHRERDATKSRDPRDCCCGYNLRLEVAATASRLRCAISRAPPTAGPDNGQSA